MHFSTSVAAALAVAGFSTAAPSTHKAAKDSVNPFLGKTYFVNPYYADELNQTIAAFLAKNDTLNAARVRTVQKSIGTFVWVTSVSGLGLLNDTITAARKVQHHTGKQQIVELVLYDLPDRDCSGGQSGGEFSSADDGLNKYKHTFIDPYAAAVSF
jgi:cellulose 1,4-beta-cellobiosidase